MSNPLYAFPGDPENSAQLALFVARAQYDAAGVFHPGLLAAHLTAPLPFGHAWALSRHEADTTYLAGAHRAAHRGDVTDAELALNAVTAGLGKPHDCTAPGWDPVQDPCGACTADEARFAADRDREERHSRARLDAGRCGDCGRATMRSHDGGGTWDCGCGSRWVTIGRTGPGTGALIRPPGTIRPWPAGQGDERS